MGYCEAVCCCCGTVDRRAEGAVPDDWYHISLSRDGLEISGPLLGLPAQCEDYPGCAVPDAASNKPLACCADKKHVCPDCARRLRESNSAVRFWPDTPEIRF